MDSKSKPIQLQPFEHHLAVCWPPEKWLDLRVLVAVSGGADSVALLRAIRSLQPNRDLLEVSHVNHGLRGNESDADENFVRELCRELDVRCDVFHADARKIDRDKAGEGIESACRRLRYEFVNRHAERIGARYVLTAHTANDQAETVLHNIIRGTGLWGLAGIPTVRAANEAVSITRPLLTVTRESVLRYLRDLGQAYRHDSSNEDTELMRNRIRLELIPLLEREYNSEVQNHVVQLSRLASDIKEDLDERLADFAGEVNSVSAEEIEVRCATFAGVSKFLASEFLMRLWRERNWNLQSMDYARWSILANMLCANEAQIAFRSIDMPGRIRVTRQADILRLERIADSRDQAPAWSRGVRRSTNFPT